MGEKLLEHIIEKARQGDYGLIEKLLNISSERLLYKVLPEDLKREIFDNMIGQPIFLLIQKKKDHEHIVSYIDEIESFSAMHVMIADSKEDENCISVELLEGTITSGNESDGWQYTLEGAKRIWKEYFLTDEVEGTDFEASVTYNIKGKMAQDFTREDLTDYLQSIDPTIYNESIMGAQVKYEACKLNVKS